MKKMFLFIFFSYFLFFFLIPPLQTPDESAHYENVYWMTRDVYPYVPPHFKPNPHAYTDSINKLFAIGINHPMLIPNYAAIANSYEATHTSYPNIKFLPISIQAYNPPGYYVLGALFLKLAQVLNIRLLTQFYVARLASATFYFGTVCLASKILTLLFKKQRIQKGLLLFFALNPLLIACGIGINPDIAITFFTTLFFYLILRERQANILFTKNKLILLGIVAGIASLSKISGVFLVPAFVVYLFFLKANKKQWLFGSIVFISTFLITQIPWSILNIVRYHSLVVTEVALGPATKTLASPVIIAVFSAIFEFRHTFMHYAGFFGWNDAYPFPAIFTLFVVGFVGLLLLGSYVILCEKNKKNIFFIIAISSMLLFFYGLSLERKLFYPGWDIQGRYILPIFLPMTICVAYGLAKITKKTLEQVAPYLLYFAIFYYFLTFIFTLLPRYYV